MDHSRKLLGQLNKYTARNNTELTILFHVLFHRHT